MKRGIYQTIVEIIAEQAVLDVSDVKPDSTVEELGLDSLGMVETLFAIEEYFDISIPFNANEMAGDAFDISTVSSIVEGVEELISLKGI